MSTDSELRFKPAYTDSSGTTIATTDQFTFLASRTVEPFGSSLDPIVVKYCDAAAGYRCRVSVLPGSYTSYVPTITGLFDEGVDDPNDIDEFRFDPPASATNRPNPRTHPENTIPPIVFKIEVVSASGAIVMETTLAQDLVNRLRQEYADSYTHHGSLFTSNAVGLKNGVPPRERVVVAPSVEIGGHWEGSTSQPLGGAECRLGPYNYYVDPTTSRGLVVDQGFIAGFMSLDSELPFPICLHNGFRCPTRNAHAGSMEVASKHQWGQALDVSYPGGRNPHPGNPGSALQVENVRKLAAIYRSASTPTHRRPLLENNNVELLPTGFPLPSPTWSFDQMVGGTVYHIAFDDSSPVDSLPDTVHVVTPPDLPAPFEFSYPTIGGRPFRIQDTNNDGVVSSGDQLQVQPEVGSFTSLFQLFCLASHVHSLGTQPSSLSTLPRSNHDSAELTDVDLLQLDASWQVAIDGQWFHPESDGFIDANNVSVRDIMGKPGEADFDVSLEGVATIDGRTRYVTSDPFRVRQGETVLFGNVTIVDEPPRVPQSIDMSLSARLVLVGTPVQATVIATFGDGSTADWTPGAVGTVYRSSNEVVATVGRNGEIAALSTGVAFITATNDAVTSVARLEVRTPFVSTELRGIVTRPDGTPLAGATVTSALSPTSVVTPNDGTFFIVGTVPGLTTSLFVRAEATLDGQPHDARVSATLVPEGVTDAGLVALTATSGLSLYPIRESLTGARFRVSVGDLERDLDLDFTGDSDHCSEIVVAYNLGHGSFASDPSTPESCTGASLARLGDLNGDGFIDFLRASTNGCEGHSIRINDGLGIFAAGFGVDLGSCDVGDAELGDVDGDGDVDIVAACCSVTRFVANLGNGAFAPPIDFPLPASDLTLADVDGDGALDIVALVGSEVRVAIGGCDGGFETPASYPLGAGGRAVLTVDFDRDGDTDIFSLRTDALVVLENVGNAAFIVRDPILFAPSTDASAFDVSDANADGQIDVAYGSGYFSGAVRLLSLDASANFLGDVPLGLGGVPRLRDFNRDGRADVLLVGNTTLLVAGDIDGGEVLPEASVLNEAANDLVAGDFDGDGDRDILLAAKLANGVMLARNDGTAHFAPGATLALAGPMPVALAGADLDGDLDLDAAVVQDDEAGLASRVSFLRNDSGTLSTVGSIALPGRLGNVVLADLDLDLDRDVLVGSTTGSLPRVSIVRNLGSNTFSAPTHLELPGKIDSNWPSVPVALDLDSDGDLDLAIGNGSRVKLFMNGGNAAFVFQAEILAQGPMYALASADFDLDGDVDLSCAVAGETIQILARTGAFAFDSSQLFAMHPGQPQRLIAADVNGDGAMDLVASSEDRIFVLKNRGALGFAPVMRHLGRAGVPAFTLSDFDGDGDIDLVTSKPEPRSIDLLRNLRIR